MSRDAAGRAGGRADWLDGTDWVAQGPAQPTGQPALKLPVARRPSFARPSRYWRYCCARGPMRRPTTITTRW